MGFFSAPGKQQTLGPAVKIILRQKVNDFYGEPGFIFLSGSASTYSISIRSYIK